jgi:DNA polymerase I-like protein with 3'-5' exonuclease and polymerase domains
MPTHDGKQGAKEDSGDLMFYVVSRVHHSKSSKEFERLKRNLLNAREMVVIGYTTSGDCGKELLSSRTMKDLPKNVMVPPMNLKEAIQMVSIRIDDAMEVFELEIAPQTSNAFALMGQSKGGNKHIESHFNLIWDILKRKVIPQSTQLVIYNTQRFLRLLQMAKGGQIDFRSFEEPPLDPFIAGFIINPEMGVEPDAERSALSMRAYEFDTMMRAFCPAIKLASKVKNLLAYDTFHTRDLALALWPALNANDLTDAFLFEMRVATVLAEMEVHGMRVDLQMLAEARKAIDAKLRELGNIAKQIIGYDILLSSPSQVSEAIYSGLEDYIAGEKSRNSALRKTSAGKHQSTKEAALLELKKRMKADGMTHMKQFKMTEIVLEHRPIHKLLSFLDAVELTAEKSKDPRFKVVYPKWLQCNTGTGRVTGASPNMQTQPTTDEIRFLVFEPDEEHEAPIHFLATQRFGSALESGASTTDSSAATVDFQINIRSAYVSRPGHTLVGADYSQIEMRILAQVSGDEELINFFKTGMDIHRQVASKVFKITPDQVSSQQREWCKRIVYGIVYGMGIQALSKSLDISSARGKEFYESFMGSFPRVQQWINSTRAHIRSTHMVRTMLGRIRTFMPGGTTDTGKYLRQGVNTAIQGSAADIVKIAMVMIDKQAFDEKVDAKLLLQIHDELIYEIKDSDVEKFKIIMKRCMEGAVPHFDVPLVINIETGTSWGLMQP